MNFIALIGIVKEKICESKDNSIIEIKVEKPYFNSEEDKYESIKVLLDNKVFSSELRIISNGTIIGIKGRIQQIKNSLSVIGERIQVF